MLKESWRRRRNGVLSNFAKGLGEGGGGRKSNEEALWLRQERLKIDKIWEKVV